MTRFSIILPCYNAQTTILQTLDSLAAQTNPQWEAICVDDGSSDNTVDVINARASVDPRIRVVRNSGKGPSCARNFGAALAREELIAFCDADDLWTPEKLKDLAETFADPSVDAVYSQTGFFNQSPSDATVFSTVPDGNLSIDMLLGENPVCTMSNIALRREAFRRTRGFDVTMVHNEDLEWLIRLVGSGASVVGLSLLHTMYRTSVGGLSTNLDAMLVGRARAIQSAARFGVYPSRRSHAIHQRYLSRRALRLGASRTLALRHAIRGLVHSPIGFFSPIRRGGLTLTGALGALVLPRAMRISVFS